MDRGDVPNGTFFDWSCASLPRHGTDAGSRPRDAARPADQPVAPNRPVLGIPDRRLRTDAGLLASPARRSRPAAARPRDLLLQPHELGRPVRADGRPPVPAAPLVLRSEGGRPAGRRPQPCDVLDGHGDPVQAGEERPAGGDPPGRRGRRSRRSRRDRGRGSDPPARVAAPAVERWRCLLCAPLGRPTRPRGHQRDELASLRGSGPPTVGIPRQLP